MLPEQKLQSMGTLPDIRTALPFKKVEPYEKSVLPFRLKDAIPFMARGAARLNEYGTRFIVADMHGNYPANLVNAVVHAGNALAEAAKVPEDQSVLEVVQTLRPFSNVSVDEIRIQLLNPDPVVPNNIRLTTPQRIGLIVLDYQNPQAPKGTDNQCSISLGALDFINEEVFVYPVPGLSKQTEIE